MSKDGRISVEGQNMIALQYAQFGEPIDVVRPANVPIADPGAGEVRMRMLCSPIHNHDLATIRGGYGARPTLPAIGGSELLGLVDAAGAGVTNVKPGDRVSCTTRGAWAEYMILPAAGLAPVPDGISDEVACQLQAMPLSALVLVDELHLERGDWFVQNAAAGTVGTIVMREAQHRGINVVNLVRSDASAERMRSDGAMHVVNVSDASWPKRVREITGNAPILRAVDSIGGPQSMQVQMLLAPRGEMIVFGGLDAQAIKLDPGTMIMNELVVRGFWMYTWFMRPENHDRLRAAIKRVYELALAGDLPLPVSRVMRLDDCQDAFIEAERSGRHGKVLFAVAAS